MPAEARFCPGCGRSMQVVLRAQGRVGVLSENVAAVLAYLTFLPALFFLFVEPYRKNLFLRFHSLQCLFFTAALLVAALLLRLAGAVLFIIPVVGPLLVVLIDVVAALAAVLNWVVLLVKAFQGETFKIPILGDLSEHYSSKF